jgi:hypothetical protein
MKPLPIVSFERRLEDLFGKTGAITDLQTQAHWSRYLCVLVSSYLEVSVREALSQYTRNRAQPNVLNYVESQLNWFQNPNLERISQLLGAFDPDISVKVAALDQATKDAINSINNNRNQIAHGRDVGIGVATITLYYSEAKRFVDFLCAELD